MNSKKQTIWLVSMLSLMVVLSAYYLFTEDVKELDIATTAAGLKTDEIVVNTGQLDTGAPAAADAKAVSAKVSEAKTDAKATDLKAAEAKTADPKAETKADGKSSGAAAGVGQAQPVSKTDAGAVTEEAKVLQNMQATAKATSGTDFFISQQLKRNEELAKQVESLMTIATDPKKSKEEAAKAQEELGRLQDTQDKVTSLEESLMKDYPQAVVTQDASKWKVTVQATKLERSQAVSIVDKAIEELGLKPDQIKVEMKP
ncbi:SpoIIIAH-like family protein [Paenibacillus puerhi]|uniref:SpoIIIAH-like family protein n=1 Tax=Paenibacillus puerhi TaxID=2692622 RepID=UPI001359AA47|nr:SpoIIIAH-like family protein [Paenibacillus puerhi]